MNPFKKNNFRKQIIFILLIFLFFNSQFLIAQNSPDLAEKINLKNKKLIAEAQKLINKKGFFLPAPPTNNNETITAYLKKYDIFTSHVSPKEYKNIKSAKNYKGLGLNLIKDKNNNIVCLPWPNSPAERYGLKYGDILLKINKQNITTLNLISIQQLIEETENYSTLTILQNKEEKEFVIKKELLKNTGIYFQETKNFNYFRFTSFKPKSFKNFKKEIKNINTRKTIILDLRGNTGGYLNEAQKIANLFLENNLIINKEINRKGYEKIRRATGKKAIKNKVVIWQDNLTASAAEVLTAALTENNRALSLGDNSFGKNLAQEVFKSKTEGYYFLSTKQLKTPKGYNYYLQGLKPNIYLNEKTNASYFLESEFYITK